MRSWGTMELALLLPKLELFELEFECTFENNVLKVSFNVLNVSFCGRRVCSEHGAGIHPRPRIQVHGKELFV